jgi:hypothetical protein
MTVLAVLETGQERVDELRGELGRARVILDRTDAVLASADSTLDRVQTAVVVGRRWAPVVAAVAGVVAVGVATLVVVAIVNRRRARRDANPAADEAPPPTRL